MTCLACSDCTALAIARYVLPVPAGPMPNTMVCSSIASTYRFWLSVFGRMVRPRREMMFSPSTWLGDSAADPAGPGSASMPIVRRTASGVITEPDSCSASSSRMVRSAKATSSALPRRVTRLPRTWMSAARFSSSSRKQCVAGAEQAHHLPLVGDHEGRLTDRPVGGPGGQLGRAGHLVHGAGDWTIGSGGIDGGVTVTGKVGPRCGRRGIRHLLHCLLSLVAVESRLAGSR